MDELDKRLCNDLSTEIPVPDKCEKVIRESLYNKEKIRKQHFYAITKIITTACASLLLSTGVVFAGYKIYEKIWKEPEKLTGFYTDDGGIITEQEKDKAMSEEEVKKIAMEKLEIFGHKDEKIEKINLQNSSDNTGLTWRIDTNKNTIITIDAENSSNYGISFKDTLDKNIEEYRTTEKEAIDTAKNFCIKYGYDTEEYDGVKVSSNMDSEKDSYIWYVDFYKEYDGIINPYECISIGFIPERNELYYFIVENDKYENDQIQITEQQAIEIVTKEEAKINTKYEMKDITTNLGIVCMNGLAYFRTTEYEQYCKQAFLDYPAENRVDYRTEKHIRKAWIVTVNYDIPESVNKFDGTYNKNEEKFNYYIDVSTGEIIGGTPLILNL